MRPCLGITLLALVTSAALGCAATPAGEETAVQEGAMFGNVSSLEDHPCGVLADDAAVYWVECAAGGGVHRREHGWLASKKTLAREPADVNWDGMPRALSSDATALYWVNAGGQVRAVEKSGGATRTLAELPDSCCGWDLVVDPEPDGSVWVAGVSKLFRIPKAGGAPTVVIQMPEGGGLDRPMYVFDMVSDGPTLFFKRDVAGGTPELVAFPKSGNYPADARVIAQSLLGGPLAVDDTFVYFTNTTNAYRETERAFRVRKTGGTPEVLGDTQMDTTHAIDVEGDVLCVGSLTIDELRCMKKAGGNAKLVATGSVSSIHITSNAIFWTDKTRTTGELGLGYNGDQPKSGSVHRSRIPWL